MQKILQTFFIYFGLVSVLFAQPNVLTCKKNCETFDANDEYTFQARFAQGHDLGLILPNFLNEYSKSF